MFYESSKEGHYKPILVKSSFKGNYKYYESRGDKEKRLSVRQYLNKIVPHLYDLINNLRIPRRVWKIQISMRINFISSKDTAETRIIYVWSDNVSIIWGSDTDDIIRELFRSFLHNYQKKLKIIKGSKFVFERVELMDYKLHRVRLRRGGPYIKSPEWLLHKKATINPKNKNDDEWLQWSTISALNYNEIMEFENIFKKIKHEDKDFSSQQKDWENFEQNNESIALNVLSSSQDREEITLVYKSENNYNRENNALLLMISDDDDEKYYYFAVKSKLELYSSEWLRSKTQSITNADNYLQDALNDSLDYQRIKKIPQEMSKLKPYINQYNWKGITFPSDKEDWNKFEQNNKEIALNILFVPHNKKEIRPAYISKYNHKRKKQVILLMITDDGKRWHYLAVRSLSALLRGISSSNNGDFYCLNCFHSY